MEEHLVWLVGNEDISFWYDSWALGGPLYTHLADGERPRDIKRREVFLNGEWREDNVGHIYICSDIALLMF